MCYIIERRKIKLFYIIICNYAVNVLLFGEGINWGPVCYMLLKSVGGNMTFELVFEKIKDADSKGDNQEKYKLMRIKDKLEAELSRVRLNSKMI